MMGSNFYLSRCILAAPWPSWRRSRVRPSPPYKPPGQTNISPTCEFNIFGSYCIFSVYRTRGQTIPQWSSSCCQIRVFLRASANMVLQRIWTIILEERKVDCLVSAELNCVERRFQRVLSISRKSGWQQVWSTEEGIIISNNANAFNFGMIYKTAIPYSAQKRCLQDF